MVIFITGGSGSGKSEYAEQRAVALKEQTVQNDVIENRKTRSQEKDNQEKDNQGVQLVYIATMEAQDEESRKRIERHQRMREGKAFITRECYTHLEELKVGEQEIVLLECLSNLTANEMFSSKGRKECVVSAIKQGLCHVMEQSRDCIIVGNNVFEDGMQYDETTEQYLGQMAKLHRFLAERADEVIEVVCGIPVFWKGEEYEIH